MELNSVEISFFKVLGRMRKRFSDGNDLFFGGRVELAELQGPVGFVVGGLNI